MVVTISFLCFCASSLSQRYRTIANGSLYIFWGRDKSKANFFFCFVISSVLPLFTSLSPILPRYLCFYLVTSRKFGVSQRDSSIFFTPNGPRTQRSIDNVTVLTFRPSFIKPLCALAWSTGRTPCCPCRRSWSASGCGRESGRTR